MDNWAPGSSPGSFETSLIDAIGNIFEFNCKIVTNDDEITLQQERAILPTVESPPVIKIPSPPLTSVSAPSFISTNVQPQLQIPQQIIPITLPTNVLPSTQSPQFSGLNLQPTTFIGSNYNPNQQAYTSSSLLHNFNNMRNLYTTPQANQRHHSQMQPPQRPLSTPNHLASSLPPVSTFLGRNSNIFPQTGVFSNPIHTTMQQTLQSPISTIQQNMSRSTSFVTSNATNNVSIQSPSVSAPNQRVILSSGNYNYVTNVSTQL